MSILNFAEQFLEHWPTILIASSILLVYLYFIVPYRTLKAVCPKGPTPLPFIGHSLDAIKHKGSMHLQIDEYYKKYGDVFSMFILGNMSSIVVSDPDLLRDLFVKDFASFADRPEFFKQPEPLCYMMSEAKKEQWKRIRNTLTPSFSALKMKQMVPLMNASCDNLIKKLGEFVDTEKSVDIQKIHQCLTMEVILSSVFGFQVDAQNNPDDPVLNAAKLTMSQTTFQKIILGGVTLLPFGMKLLENIPALFLSNFTPLLKISEEIVQIKKGSVGRSSRKDMLDLMLSAADDSSLPESKKLSDAEIIAQSFVFLAAGYETTSTTLSFMSHHLAVDPEIQEKVQQEIDSVWPDENQMLSYDAVHEMPYLDMVAAEVLRMYPPGFITARACTEECTIKGIKMAEGLTVVVPIYSIHRDPRYYPNPDKFDPDRFLPAAKQSRNPYTYLPFGHGPRNCIGMRFAQMEMKLAMARILKKYSFEVAPDTKIPPEVTISSTLTCSGVNVRVKSRNK